MRMMMVRFILEDLTTPVKMRPRMDTLPVKGHFLSMYVPVARVMIRRGKAEGQRDAKRGDGRCRARGIDGKTPSRARREKALLCRDAFARDGNARAGPRRRHAPSIAERGVLKPRPTFL